ncbi:hypothetical protein Enr13x_27950 [Stieleria neptunia]|uniref:RepB-like DNA primase domain-containing protein n=1 Tax=Stieleria neptunia TaxID=2527979 RepID=A0A518HQ26_9BACT|nr:hypothetical protein [Stieleria neptunia]QDV42943.1 hypothetical protein Enr13x_27950 [Stieleria neptunia]
MNGPGETAAWLDALYSRCTPDDGELVFVDSTKRKTVGMAKAGDPDELVKAANAMNGRLDQYLKINPMDGDAIRARAERDGKGRYIVGSANEVKTIVSFHLDCDAGKSSKYHTRETMLRLLDKMPRKPSLIVNSDGPEGGFHCYWILANPFRIKSDDDREYIKRLTKRWQDKLNSLAGGKLDSTANIDRVLRVVGQGRSNGNAVTCHEYHPERLYSLRELSLPASQSEIKTSATKFARQVIRETLGKCDTSDQPITAYIDASNLTVEDLLAQNGYQQLRGDEWIREGSVSGARTLKIATEADRPGINVFSGNETRFPCLKDDGSVGRFYSIDQMFVTLRHGGDWKAAARWCHEQIESQSGRGPA